MLSFPINSLTHIVVAAGGYQPRVLARSLVIQSRLPHAASNFAAHRRLIEGVPSAAHAYEIGAAVNLSSIVVLREPLSPMISEHDFIYHYVADAQRRDVIEVLLEY